MAITITDIQEKADAISDVQQKVDVITGATYSSEAVIENVKRGLDHYSKKGKK